jgi:membrane-associated phospholipid phosphatase
MPTTTNNNASMNKSTTSFGLNLFPMAFLGCLLLTTTGVEIWNFAYAQQQEDPTSLVGTYSKGYDVGKLTSASTYKVGGAHNSSCPAGHSFTYCLGYHAGYDWQWAQLKISSWWQQMSMSSK